MLVELFALPGSGKTTVASAAAQRSGATTRKDLSAAWAEISALRRAAYIGWAFANPTVLKAARLCLWRPYSDFGKHFPIGAAVGQERLAKVAARRDIAGPGFPSGFVVNPDGHKFQPCRPPIAVAACSGLV